MGTIIEHKPIEIPETKPEKVLKKLALWGTSAFFIFTGLRHLLIPDFYIIMMPSYLPVPLFIIYFTGIFQVVCAIGLLFLRTRKISAYGLMAFLIAALPILVLMWVHKESVPTSYVPSWLQLLSVPLQFLLIFWMYLFSNKPESY